jgi:branched-chain amino acid transport system substrate-binding protein
MQNKSNKFKIVTSIIIVVALIIIGLGYSKTSTQQSMNDKVTFGALAPLTGQTSVLGERMRNGMELAKEDVVSQGIIKNFSMQYEDACDGKSSTNAVEKLVNADKVKVISSAFCLFGEDVVVPTTEKEGVIFFNTAANPESLLNKQYAFSTNVAIRVDAYKMAEYAYNTLGARTAALIQLQTSFGESYRMNFTQKFEELGGKVLSADAKSPDATDFRTEAARVKTENPDLLLVIHFGSSLGNAVKQAREVGVKSIIMGDYESEDPTVLNLAGKAAEGMIISSSQPEVATAHVLDFQKRYMAKYGEMPDVLATNAYDAVMIQAQAYASCNGDTACMSKQIASIKDFAGVSGQITIDPADHSVTKPTIFKVVKDGKFVELK